MNNFKTNKRNKNVEPGHRTQKYSPYINIRKFIENGDTWSISFPECKAGSGNKIDMWCTILAVESSFLIAHARSLDKGHGTKALGTGYSASAHLDDFDFTLHAQNDLLQSRRCPG